MAAKGDGQTQLARKLIRDFIAQDQALGSDLKLDKAQLIYAEDTLRRNFGEAMVKPDQVFSIKGEKIMEAIKQAKNLSAEKLQNIQDNFVPKISEETWRKMTDYGSVVINSEAIEAVKAEAEKKATEAVSGAVQEAMQMAAEAKNVVPEIVRKTDPNFELLRKLELIKKYGKSNQTKNVEAKDAEIDKISLKKQILGLIEESKEGVSYIDILQKIKSPQPEVESVINDLLSGGICYEPSPGVIRKI